MSFQDEMEQYDEQWKEDHERERPTFTTLKDGPHQVIVDECRIEKDDDGLYTWYMRFQNREGSIRKWSNLDHEVGRSVAAQDAKTMGYDGLLSGLEEACESGIFNDLVLEIKVKTKTGDERDFTNVYINRCLGKGDPASFAQEDSGEEGEGAAGSSINDDDIPF